ncbi:MULTISPECIES: SHOCT domain-containing protein [Paenibacillus]|nr:MULTISPECIES: SHOCT domain-containing protein [Paenibacillus]
MMVFWILIIGMVIYAVLLLVSKTFQKKEDPALNILKERFARGEMDQDEFERKKAALTGK